MTIKSDVSDQINVTVLVHQGYVLRLFLIFASVIEVFRENTKFLMNKILNADDSSLLIETMHGLRENFEMEGDFVKD